ncbi:MAG TPA: hypothetical protein VHY56_00425, partial [Candidatus Binataceae bacterium]|nr:hypothetical protein [Candidatus Binataceae bacterium]
VLANLTNRYWRDNLNEETPQPPELLRRLLTPPQGRTTTNIWRGCAFWNAGEIDKNLAAIVAAKEMP